MRDKERHGHTEEVKHSDRETSRRWIQRKRETDVEIETSSD
jgi:hypothetical protein